MGPKNLAAALVLLLQITIPAALRAQDVPGIEICTAEKAMDRRTSCLQSNVEFLQKTMTRLTGDHQQKLDAANRQIEALKATIAGLQKVIADLQAAQKQMAEDMKKLEPAKGAIAPAAKEGAKQ
jgi:predicted  nucleic acid-binding Zn-ribbon protein